jgi:type II restriction/modification system DNA methylase subunit YeeA
VTIEALTPTAFIEKWRDNPLTERQASHTHFIDLCRMLGEPAPYDADTDADAYCFEKGATKTTGADGWADVWKRGAFGWEYKGPRKDLTAAYAQLQQYAVALENPPLLVVCDREHFRIHTNFTNSISKVYDIALTDLADPDNRAILKAVFSDPESLRPGKTRQSLTVEVAEQFANLALRLRGRGHDPVVTAHFINRLVFCMFAEDVKLLPNDMFKRMLENALRQPEEFKDLAADLFRAMQSGGRVGFERVDWFNGGLFDSDTTLPLEGEDIALVLDVARQDWSDIDPSILGTLFERGLDPDKRSQLGAHYTDRDKIMQIVRPVLVAPLLEEWEKRKSEIALQMDAYEKARARRPERQTDARRVFAAARREEERAWREAQRLYIEFVERLRKVRVLDPACGSGNFLYLALLALKDIEHKVNLDAEVMGLGRFTPSVGPECLKGIEINPYAAELARVTVWIGEIQWMRRNGFDTSRNPILRPLDTIECRDAVLGPNGAEAPWPPCEFIIGNPPFLGAKLMKRWLGQPYTDSLREAYKGRLKGFSDLVCYWFEKARAEIQTDHTRRVGLVATSSIRGGTNRPVLDRIAQDAMIFDAWGEQPWTVEGARVEVSLICFCARSEAPQTLRLDGQVVQTINADLTTGIDVTRAVALKQNNGTSFLGIQTSGPHDIPGDMARTMMALPVNPNGQANHEVLKPYWNGDDVAGRPRDRWLIDLPLNLTEGDAARYEAPFEYLRTARYDAASATDLRTLPEARATARDTHARERWWEPYWPRPEMRARVQALSRYIVTTETSQYRLFVWLSYPVLPDKNLIVIARDDDTTFGILHSRFHELWSLRLGTSLEDRPRYTSTTTFATFPFPDGLTPDIPSAKYAANPVAKKIAAAAKQLDQLRNAWLNPNDLIRREPETRAGFPERTLPVSSSAEATLRTRTLTELYNQRPAWLVSVHRELDEAVAEAYGLQADSPEDAILAHLVDLNLARTSAKSL